MEPNGIAYNASSDSRHLQVKVIDDESGMIAVWIQDGNFSDIYANQLIGMEMKCGILGIPILKQIMTR